MMTEIVLSGYLQWCGGRELAISLDHESSEIGGRGRPEPDIPTGLNLGMPWQWEGDVRAKRAMLGLPGWDAFTLGFGRRELPDNRSASYFSRLPSSKVSAFHRSVLPVSHHVSHSQSTE